MPHLPSHAHLDRLGIPCEKATFPVSTEKGKYPYRITVQHLP